MRAQNSYTAKEARLLRYGPGPTMPGMQPQPLRPGEVPQGAPNAPKLAPFQMTHPSQAPMMANHCIQQQVEPLCTKTRRYQLAVLKQRLWAYDHRVKDAELVFKTRKREYDASMPKQNPKQQRMEQWFPQMQKVSKEQQGRKDLMDQAFAHWNKLKAEQTIVRNQVVFLEGEEKVGMPDPVQEALDRGVPIAPHMIPNYGVAMAPGYGPDGMPMGPAMAPSTGPTPLSMESPQEQARVQSLVERYMRAKTAEDQMLAEGMLRLAGVDVEMSDFRTMNVMMLPKDGIERTIAMFMGLMQVLIGMIEKLRGEKTLLNKEGGAEEVPAPGSGIEDMTEKERLDEIKKNDERIEGLEKEKGERLKRKEDNEHSLKLAAPDKRAEVEQRVKKEDAEIDKRIKEIDEEIQKLKARNEALKAQNKKEAENELTPEMVKARARRMIGKEMEGIRASIAASPGSPEEKRMALQFIEQAFSVVIDSIIVERKGDNWHVGFNFNTPRVWEMLGIRSQEQFEHEFGVFAKRMPALSRDMKFSIDSKNGTVTTVMTDKELRKDLGFPVRVKVSTGEEIPPPRSPEDLPPGEAPESNESRESKNRRKRIDEIIEKLSKLKDEKTLVDARINQLDALIGAGGAARTVNKYKKEKEDRIKKSDALEKEVDVLEAEKKALEDIENVKLIEGLKKAMLQRLEPVAKELARIFSTAPGRFIPGFPILGEAIGQKGAEVLRDQLMKSLKIERVGDGKVVLEIDVTEMKIPEEYKQRIAKTLEFKFNEGRMSIGPVNEEELRRILSGTISTPPIVPPVRPRPIPPRPDTQPPKPYEETSPSDIKPFAEAIAKEFARLDRDIFLLSKRYLEGDYEGRIKEAKGKGGAAKKAAEVLEAAKRNTDLDSDDITVISTYEKAIKEFERAMNEFDKVSPAKKLAPKPGEPEEVPAPKPKEGFFKESNDPNEVDSAHSSFRKLSLEQQKAVILSMPEFTGTFVQFASPAIPEMIRKVNAHIKQLKEVASSLDTADRQSLGQVQTKILALQNQYGISMGLRVTMLGIDSVSTPEDYVTLLHLRQRAQYMAWFAQAITKTLNPKAK